ncbi:thiamine phosphate synthase [Chelatococcus sp. XZ-Ab1]|uniref:thiamine phosphate synthase n=1 Tax=Chelatococcus sp. XZ-Ab1 TaxID=3034027 RepID=UPI0023E3FC9B|nr:thiamine phosphate synthase [Chelatococcus sp. XZ-Ab1]
MALPQPPLLLVTDRRQARGDLVAVVQAAVAGGCRWVSLREKDLPEDEQVALALRLRDALAADVCLTVHGSAEVARQAGLGGVHLAAGGDARRAREMLGRAYSLPPCGGGLGRGVMPPGGPPSPLATPPTPSPSPQGGGEQGVPGLFGAPHALIGMSVHSPGEARALDPETVDYAIAGPFAETASKPGYGPALGVDGLAAIVRASPVPVIAIGGIDAANVAHCLAAGAAGIAVMGSVMRAADPAAEMARLVAALAGAQPRGR